MIERSARAAQAVPTAPLEALRPASRSITVLEIDCERGWRGGERQVLYHAQVLQRLGHRVLVAARPDEPLAQRAAASGVKVIACRPLVEFDPLAALALHRTIQEHKVDIVHAHTAHGIALGAMATRGTDARFVVTRHLAFPLRQNAGTRWKYRCADRVLAVSSAVARSLVASGVNPAQVQVVRIGVDLSERADGMSPDALRALGVPPGSPLVVQVSQLVDHKNPLVMVHAIATARRHVPKLQALLVGEGPLRPAIERVVSQLGLGDNLHLLGYRNDCDELMASADVVTLSSDVEGLPTVLIDALRLGKPVAATAGDGVDEVVENGVSGLLAPPGDSEALGTAIAALIENRALRARMATAAAQRAEEFSIERSVQETLAVYLELLDSGVRT